MDWNAEPHAQQHDGADADAFHAAHDAVTNSHTWHPSCICPELRIHVYAIVAMSDVNSRGTAG